LNHSGVTQALKGSTSTADFRRTEGFSFEPNIGVTSLTKLFLTPRPGVLQEEQNTVTLGLVWWFGRKQGTW
jgi:hypothetical protein